MLLFDDPVEFLEAVNEADVESESAELREAGYLAGAVRRFEGSTNRFATSAVVQFASAAAAREQAGRLWEDIIDDLPAATTAAVADIPGSRSFRLTGSEGDQEFAGAGVVFTDGPLLVEVIAFGPPDVVDPDVVIGAASDLFARTGGAPLPPAPPSERALDA